MRFGGRRLLHQTDCHRNTRKPASLCAFGALLSVLEIYFTSPYSYFANLPHAFLDRPHLRPYWSVYSQDDMGDRLLAPSLRPSTPGHTANPYTYRVGACSR